MSKTPSNWYPSGNHIDEFLKCAADNNITRAQELLKLFPDDIINSTDESENTALHLAAKNGHLDMVKLLVNNGANLYARNDQGSTAFQEAKANQRTAMGYLLGYADTEPVHTYLNQMDAILREFIEIAQGVSEDRSARMGTMLKLAPWILKAKTENGEIVKDLEGLPNSKVADLKRARKRISTDQDEAISAKTLGIRAADMAQLTEAHKQKIQKRREAASAKSAEKMKVAAIKQKEALKTKAGKSAEMKRKREEKIAEIIAEKKAKEKESKQRRDRSKKASDLGKKVRDEQLREAFFKQKEFEALPNEAAIDVERAKDRIAIDQDKSRAELEARKQAEVRAEFEMLQAEVRAELEARKQAELRVKKSTELKDKITNFQGNLEKSLQGEDKLQAEMKKIAGGFKWQPEFVDTIDQVLKGHIDNKKSRTSAKIARFVLGRKTDKDMLKEAMTEFKKAITQENYSPEINPIDRWSSWKQSKNKKSNTQSK